MILAMMKAVLSLAGTCKSQHPAVLLCRSYWRCLEWPLLQLPSSIDVDGHLQPLAAALEVISTACGVPSLLAESLELLLRSAKMRPGGLENCFNVLNEVIQKVPGTALEEAQAIEVIVRRVHELSQVALLSSEVLQEPATVKALYLLWIRGLAVKAGGACGGFLRKALLGNLLLLEKLLELLCVSLPVFALDASVRWLTLLLPSHDLPEVNNLIFKFLPKICQSVSTTLTEQELFIKWESGFLHAAECLYLAADAYPSFPEAFSQALASLEWLPLSCRRQLSQHVLRRHEWPTRSSWMSTLQLLLQDCQREQKQQVAAEVGIAQVLGCK